MPSIFDEAGRAAEERFTAAEEPATPEVIPEETAGTEGEEIPAETPADIPADVPAEQTTLGAAAQTAEIAAQVASEKDAELQAIKQLLEEEKRKNEQLTGTVQNLSQINEQKLVEEAILPPKLDIASLAFADEETCNAAQEQYAKDMAEYNRRSFMQEFAPVIEQANEMKYQKDRDELISALTHVPELKGIDTMVPQLERIIATNKALSAPDLPLEEKLITAFIIATGANSLNNPPAPPKELTPDELLELYNKNPDFQDLVEKQRISQVKNSQQVPPFSASSGAVNAALDITEEPKGWDEAFSRASKRFKN